MFQITYMILKMYPSGLPKVLLDGTKTTQVLITIIILLQTQAFHTQAGKHFSEQKKVNRTTLSCYEKTLDYSTKWGVCSPAFLQINLAIPDLIWDCCILYKYFKYL